MTRSPPMNSLFRLTWRSTALRACLVGTLALSGCATPIERTRPAIELPASWTEASPASDTLQRDWWRGFRSAICPIRRSEARLFVCTIGQRKAK